MVDNDWNYRVVCNNSSLLTLSIVGVIFGVNLDDELNYSLEKTKRIYVTL